jgi:hypothetical protein
MDFTLQSLAKDNTAKPKPPQNVEDQRHHDMMQAIAPYAKPAQQKNLTRSTWIIKHVRLRWC